VDAPMISCLKQAEQTLERYGRFQLTGTTLYRSSTSSSLHGYRSTRHTTNWSHV